MRANHLRHQDQMQAFTQSGDISEMLIQISDISKTSVDFIDMEHKQLADSINRLWQLVENNSIQNNADSEITGKLQEIITHLQDHFGHEEELMAKNSFPAAGHHKKRTSVFLNKLNKACVDFILYWHAWNVINCSLWNSSRNGLVIIRSKHSLQ